jgi:cyclin B
MLKHHPSMLAAASLFLAQKILKSQYPWPEHLKTHAQFSESQLRPCAKDMVILLQNAHRYNLKAVHKKFSMTKFHEVASLRLQV